MILIIAVDDDYGMMFHNRRQSQDRVLREKILGLIGGKCLWMNPYTKKQFTEIGDTAQIHVEDGFLEKVPLGDYCFVENEPVSSYEDQIEKIVLFKWNRKYPSDFYLDIHLQDNWEIVSTVEFAGYSHDKITMEVYER